MYRFVEDFSGLFRKVVRRMWLPTDFKEALVALVIPKISNPTFSKSYAIPKSSEEISRIQIPKPTRDNEWAHRWVALEVMLACSPRPKQYRATVVLLHISQLEILQDRSQFFLSECPQVFPALDGLECFFFLTRLRHTFWLWYDVLASSQSSGQCKTLTSRMVGTCANPVK